MKVVDKALAQHALFYAMMTKAPKKAKVLGGLWYITQGFGVVRLEGDSDTLVKYERTKKYAKLPVVNLTEDLKLHRIYLDNGKTLWVLFGKGLVDMEFATNCQALLQDFIENTVKLDKSTHVVVALPNISSYLYEKAKETWLDVLLNRRPHNKLVIVFKKEAVLHRKIKALVAAEVSHLSGLPKKDIVICQ